METIYVAILPEYQENLSRSDRRGLPDKCVTQPNRMVTFNTSETIERENNKICNYVVSIGSVSSPLRKKLKEISRKTKCLN